jgi:SET domain-containing protein
MTMTARRQQDERQASSTSTTRAKGLVLRDVPGKGRGVFATRAFAQGEEVLQFLGEVKDVSSFPDLTHALQIDTRHFLSSSGGIDDYVNHSCEPNCGIRQDARGRVLLFALKPIALDEEISFDYSTTQGGGFWEMTCGCGTKNCRKTIGDFADLPAATRERYVALGAVMPFLVK